MKRTLIILALAALLVLPLIITGCSCGGTTLTESDKATIQGFGKRLDDHDKAIATINNTLNSLGTETLGKLANLDADELTALVNLDLDTALTDIKQLKADMGNIKDIDKEGSLADLAARVEALENGAAGGGRGQRVLAEGNLHPLGHAIQHERADEEGGQGGDARGQPGNGNRRPGHAGPAGPGAGFVEYAGDQAADAVAAEDEAQGVGDLVDESAGEPHHLN